MDSNLENLTIFTKKDNKTTSSIKISGHQKKLVKPVPQGRYWGVNQMYVNPCPVHDDETPTLPVDTYAFDEEKQGGIFLGTRRYCVMCWTWVDAEETLKKENEESEIRPDKTKEVVPVDIEI